ncbi:MAG: FAD-dependent oxidoreductase [Bacteroidales bacterium]|nr:FAD-dependent oxidoreductase [Bacteroidales bacterium]
MKKIAIILACVLLACCKEPLPPVLASADIVVVGGGPAGVSAAYAAAREGAKTVLIEKEGFLGGLWTGGLVLPLNACRALEKNGTVGQSCTGIMGEMVQRLDSLGMIYPNEEHSGPVPDPEATKYLLDCMMEEAGVQVIYYALATGIVKKKNRIDAVILETKGGRYAVKGRQFIDCTGDGDVFAWAGEEFELRKYAIGAMYRLGGVPDDMKLGYKTPIPGVRSMNVKSELDQNGLDVLNNSRLQTLIRKRIWEETQSFKKRDGGENIFLLDTPAKLGIRMTRVLKGRYCVTMDDSMNWTEFPDCIGLAGRDNKQTYNGEVYKWSERPVWQIPYRALLPWKTDNLLVAGRCCSFDEGLTWDAREVGTCIVTGQAAGTAAALCLQQGTTPSGLDVGLLQETLRNRNVRLAF